MSATIVLKTILGESDPDVRRRELDDAQGTPGRMFRVAELREEMWPTPSGIRYVVRVAGPVVTKMGRDHSSWTGCGSYFDDVVPGELADYQQRLFPRELAHLVRGRAALEQLLTVPAGGAR